jgi:hypothetical protein
MELVSYSKISQLHFLACVTVPQDHKFFSLLSDFSKFVLVPVVQYPSNLFSTMTAILAGLPNIPVCTSKEEEDFSFLQCPDQFRDTPSLLFSGYGGSFSVNETDRRLVNYSSASGAES